MTTWADGMTFRDADGDGLLAQTFNGNDPDDTTWDTDGDGLSDAWELDRSSVSADEGGQFFDPRDPDTDDDGLDDKEEVLAGTNPNNGDTDGDTISDPSEVVDGWKFTYAQGKSIRVYSDPLQTDADGDGMDDLFERTLHTCPGCDPLENRYHPYVWNTNPIGLYAEVGDPDGVVRPGQTFPYTTTVQNNLNPDLWVRGSTDLTADPLTGGPLDMSFDIAREQSQSLYSNLTVAGGTGNQDVDMTTEMLTQLHTPSVWTWDPEQSSDRATAIGETPESVTVTPVDNWTVPYAVATLENDRVYVYPATADGITASGAHVVGGAGDESNGAPGVVCTDDGTCLVVWSSHYTPADESYFRWRRIVPTLEVTGTVETVTGPVGGRTYGSAVASDGGGFLTVWMEGTAISRTLKANHVNGHGTPSSPTLTIDAGGLVQALAQHCLERYGSREVSRWYWELWNEPDLLYYWHGTVEAYCRLYDHTVAGLTAALDQARIGGPATTNPGRPNAGAFLRAFLGHCANGINAVTGERSTRLDFISFHSKGGTLDVFSPTEKHTPTIDRLVNNVAVGLEIAASFPEMKGKEVIVSECDPDGWAAGSMRDSPNLEYRNTEYYGSFLASAACKLLDLDVDASLRVDGMLTWAFEFEDRNYFEGLRTLSTNDVDKPVLNVLRLLAELGGMRLHLTCDAARAPLEQDPARAPLEQDSADAGQTAPDISGIAAIDGSGEVQVLLCSHHDDWDVRTPTGVSVEVTGLEPGRDYWLQRTVIDSVHNNTYTAWVEMGRPQQPSEEQLRTLKRMSVLQVTEETEISAEGERCRFSVRLASHCVCLIKLTPILGS